MASKGYIDVKKLRLNNGVKALCGPLQSAAVKQLIYFLAQWHKKPLR